VLDVADVELFNLKILLEKNLFSQLFSHLTENDTRNKKRVIEKGELRWLGAFSAAY